MIPFLLCSVLVCSMVLANCIGLYLHGHTYIRTYGYLHICIHIYIYIFLHICMYMHIQINIDIQVIFIFVFMLILIFIFVHIYIYMNPHSILPLVLSSCFFYRFMNITMCIQFVNPLHIDCRSLPPSSPPELRAPRHVVASCSSLWRARDL